VLPVTRSISRPLTRERSVQSPSRRSWQVHNQEITLRKEIILSAFVNHAQIAVSLWLRVGKDSVNLVQFKRRRIFGVVHAYREPRRCLLLCLHTSIQIEFSLDFPLTNPMRFVPMQLRPANTAIGEVNRGDAFEFAPASRPYCFFNRARSRIEPPTAMTSTFVMSLSISKDSMGHCH